MLTKNIIKKMYCNYLEVFNTNEKIVFISVKDLISSAIFLKHHVGYQYKILSCVSGVDILRSSFRFCIVYDFLSLQLSSRLRVKVLISDLEPIPSLVELHPSANWYEREIYDMYGIIFQGNPDLRRLLTDYGFEGAPLRKDFPLSGYLEAMYTIDKVDLIPVTLTQESRSFNTEAAF